MKIATRSRRITMAMAGVLLITAGLTKVAHAGQLFAVGPNGQNEFQDAMVDFNTDPIGGWQFLPNGAKYHSIGFSSNGPTACYEVWTYHSLGSTGDTYIYAKRTSDANWQGLNDDYQSSTDYYSKARLWINGQGEIELALAAYNTNYNSMSFGFYILQVSGVTTAAACENSDLSFAGYDNGTLTVTNRYR